MTVGIAILVELGVILGMVLVDAILPGLSFLVILGTAIWASVDASQLEFKKYKLNGVTGPVIALIGCLLLHIIAFPWHLVNRGKVIRGEAPLKSVAPQSVAANSSGTHAGSQEDTFARLEKLAELKEKGVITEAEFNQQKSSILG